MQRFVLFICLALASSSALAPPTRTVKKIVGAVLGKAQTMVQELAARGKGLSAAEKELQRVLSSKVIKGNPGNISNNSAMMFVSKEGNTITNLKNKNKLTPLNLQDELALHLADKPDGAGLFIAQYSPNQYGLHGVTVSNGEIKLGKSDLFEVNIPKGDEDAIATPAKLLDVLVPNKERLKLKESGKLGDVAYKRLFSFFAQGLHKDEVVALNTDEITALALKTLDYFPPEVRQVFDFDAAAAGVGESQVSNGVTEAANLFKSNFPKNGSPSPKQAQATYESAVTKAPTPEAPVEAKPQAVAKTEVQKPAADEFAKFLNRMIKKSRFENHISLAQDVNLDQSTLGRHIHGYNIPTPRSMDKITEALARDANVDAAEINKLKELWAAAKRAKDNIEPKTKLTEAQREEKEKARDVFANFFGAKVKDGHYTFSRLDEELGVETTKFAKDRLPSLKTMLKLLQPDDNLATKLKFTETELDEFVDLWKRGKPQQGFTKEGQIELDGLVARTKERIRSADAQSAKPEPQAPDASQIAETADEARHVEAQETTPLKHGELIDAAEEARVKFATHFGSIFKKSSFDSLASLAQDAGLTPTTVGNFIKGVHLPTPISMNKITESLASDAKVDANEIKKLIKLFDAAKEAQVKRKKEVPRKVNITEEQGKARNEFSNFLRTKIASEHYVARHLNAELELNRGSISKYLQGNRFPNYQMMLKMLQADDNIATKLNFTADEIDEFINLWKQGNPRISQRRGGGSHGVTEEAQRELDDIVARIKERIRAADGQDTEPEAQIPVQLPPEKVDEVRHVEAEQVADKANDDKLFDSEALLKYAEENNIEDKLLNEVLKHIEDGEALTAKLKAFVKKRVEETQQKLLANLDDAMTEANISWKDIETYVDKNTSFLSVFKKEIDAAIARRTDMVKRRGGKSFYELVEERDGITATQLQEYFDGEEALGADAYAKLCVYTTMGCSEDIMRAVEQMLIVHRKALSDSKVELEIKDYLTDKNQQEWLELAYLVFDERYEQVIK